MCGLRLSVHECFTGNRTPSSTDADACLPTRAPPSNCASRRAARMAAAISRTRLRPSSMVSGIWRPAGQPHADRPCVMNQSGQHRSSHHLCREVKIEVYHFRFLFAIEKCTGARGQWGFWGMVSTVAQNGRQGGAKGSAGFGTLGGVPRGEGSGVRVVLRAAGECTQNVHRLGNSRHFRLFSLPLSC